jgi:hypothetical protein
MDSEPIPEEVIVEPVVEPVPPIDPNLRIIYRTADNGVGIIIPVIDCGLTIEQVAAKDVPAGVPFRIVDASDIPSDRTFRNAWEYTA